MAFFGNGLSTLRFQMFQWCEYGLSLQKDLGQSLRRSAPDANGEEMATLPQRSTVGHWMMREAY
jgi:hypothetical protein